jgi:phosphatidylglycerol:prolipoprotein diacylglycerol transferase
MTLDSAPILASLNYPAIDPIALRLGPIAIRWYGIAYLLGFFLGYLALKRMIRRGLLRLSLDQLGQLISWLVMGVMVGGRGGWWLFYHRADGAPEPWYEPLAVWHGGMSFHGALIGVTLATALWCWKNRTSFLHVADAIVLVAPIGLFFGRIANFINAELVGRVTSVPWGIVFPGDVQPRHPSQLYEAVLEGPLLLLMLWLVHRRTHRSGVVLSAFLMGYGALRFFVEFTRERDSQLGFIAFGWLTMGQLLSAGLVVAGVVLFLVRHQQPAVELSDFSRRVTESPQ